MLRGVADEALINYVQNPQGEVPSYLALSELQRRKDTRAKYQAEQAPESSVAEDITQETKPKGLAMLAGQPQMEMEDQGLAGLDTGDMYQEDSFASGGIVAFADGGILKKARDYLLPPSPTTMRDLQSKTKLSPFMGGLGDIEAYQYADPNYLLKKREMLYRQLDMPGADKNAIYAEINALDQQTIRPAGGYAPTEKAAMTDAEVQAKNILAQTPPPPSPVVNPYAVDTSIPRPLSVEEAMNRQNEAMKLAGVDPDFYKKQSDELLAQRDALKSDRSEAANIALIKAGLATMAGTSPFALVNLGKGAEAGIDQYGRDIKEIRSENRLLKQADLKLKEAQNAQQRGDAQGALKAIQEREKIISDLQERRISTAATLKAAEIAAGTRTGMGQLPALYNALNKAQQAGNQTLVDQIQARIDDIEAGVTGGGGSIPAGVTVKKNK